VRVIGSAKASILPSPSLTFTEVEVGGDGDAPMMTVGRFEVTIELMPLLQGQIRVVAMRLDRPVVHVVADDSGALDWLQRSTAAEALDPDKVVLAAVTIDDGTVAYSDPRRGIAIEFAGITASVEARSLAGPWRADGSYRLGDAAVPFHLATGRRLDDGSIRLKVDATSPGWPVDMSADGVVRLDPDVGLTFGGTYSASELVENVTGEAAPQGADAGSSGWRSQGTFALTGDRLAIDKAVLSNGPADRPSSLAGSLTVNFGSAPSFLASAEARQLDLDRTLGGGPNQPIEVPKAAEQLVAWLGSLPIPDVPGRIALNVPAIVVGGSVIQDVAFTATPAATGWEIGGFRARLPGQATLAADGIVTTERQVGFTGEARLAVLQPATFASWWRGGSQAGAGRELAAFDIAGRTEIAPGRIFVQDIDARIGDATIGGRFNWSEARDRHSHLGTSLKADRIDFAQIKALTELLVGRDVGDVGALADSYSVILNAGAFQYDDVRMTDVLVDAEYSDDALKITRFAIGDVGGASVEVKGGRIDNPLTNPRGHLDARLDVTTVDGLALLAGKLAPDSGIFQWLGRTADAITPAHVNAHITAPPRAGEEGIRVALDGVAGPTTFDVEVESGTAKPSDWRGAEARVTLVFDSPDSSALARQIGLAAVAADADSGAHVELHGNGVPADGMQTTAIVEIAGLTGNATGRLLFPATSLPTFAGSFGASALNLGPLLATAGLTMPGNTDDSAIELEGTVSASGAGADLAWSDGRVASHAVGGSVTLARGADRGWRLDGDLGIDRVDLDWLLSLGLGTAPLPTGDSAAPWSKSAFSAPGYGPVSGKLKVATEHLAVSDALDIANAELALVLQPQRIDIDVTGGHFAGGAASGGISIHNVEGNANITGQFTLAGASLESLIWQRDRRSVATGVVDLSASFEATGRSPAGLVSSMTGGGVVSVGDGVARYINPNAARLVVRASDLGQEFTEDSLRMTLAGQIDADSFRFGDAGGAFAIAAGTLRMKNLAVRSDKLAATGNAVLDLNQMTLDSDWTLTFDAGDSKVEGTDPQVGIVFRGPLASPARIIDPLPFSSYLNTRREARILEIIAMEEADRAERDRLARLTIKLRQDRELVERLAREAAEAEQRRHEVAAAAARNVEMLHVDRERITEERAAEALQRAAEIAAAESAAAEAAARSAAETAKAERERVATLAAAVPAAVATDEQAAAGEREAAVELAIARDAAAGADARMAQTEDAARSREQAAADAVADAAEKAAQAATAAETRRAAEAALAAATQAATATRAELAAATSEAAMSDRDLNAAGAVLSQALAASETAQAAVAAAEASLADGERAAQSSGNARNAAAQQARETAAEKARLQATANIATNLAEAAAKALEERRNAAQAAEADLTHAESALAEATKFAADAAGVAAALAADAETSEQDLAEARNTADRMQLREAARKADADRARQVLEMARSGLAAADAESAAASTKAKAAVAAVDAAIDAATGAADTAARAVAANAAALNVLSGQTAARDAAVREAEARQAAAQAAGTAFNQAQERARTASDRTSRARAAGETALAAQSDAAAKATQAAAAADAAAFAAEAAIKTREDALAAAAIARTAADEARQVAEAARAVLAERSAAHDAAVAAARTAHSARETAEASAKAAEESARTAEAAAAAAAELAVKKAAAAEAAADAAHRSAAAGAKSETAAVPAPRPRKQPISLVPDALAGDQPLVIVPP
jgi:uncharacterized protein involved in outer membrane biogenesis